MNTVLQEVASSDITPDHIKRRVDDWRRRIDQLYLELQSWLPSGMKSKQTRTQRMNEELMREFKIAPVELPVLDIVEHGRNVATLEPRALWVVGANGRLDLVSEIDHFVIVDEADAFEQARWKIAPLTDRTKLHSLDKTAFLAALAYEGSK